jgi:hypothetical protein
MVAEVFSYDQRFTVSAREAPVSSYAEAFRASREAGEDYFALVTLDETERDVRISLDLYVSRTGSRAEAFSVFRTGNDRYANALRRLVQTVASRMPVRGAVLARYQADAIIDLGRSDGVAKDQIFDVVPRASVRPANEGLALSYPADQVLASFTVTALDEDLSQGILERSGYFDRVNAGDAVIPRAKEAASGGAQEGGAKAEPVAGGEPFLLNMLRKSDRVRRGLKRVLDPLARLVIVLVAREQEFQDRAPMLPLKEQSLAEVEMRPRGRALASLIERNSPMAAIAPSQSLGRKKPSSTWRRAYSSPVSTVRSERNT